MPVEKWYQLYAGVGRTYSSKELELTASEQMLYNIISPNVHDSPKIFTHQYYSKDFYS